MNRERKARLNKTEFYEQGSLLVTFLKREHFFDTHYYFNFTEEYYNLRQGPVVPLYLCVALTKTVFFHTLKLMIIDNDFSILEYT